MTSLTLFARLAQFGGQHTVYTTNHRQIIKSMNFKRLAIPFITNAVLLSFTIQAQTGHSPVIWKLDRLDSLGGCPTETLPNQTIGPASELPSLIETERGKAAYFDGINDGILVNGNPLGQSNTWTLEVIFKPDSSTNPDHFAQRFLHIAHDYSQSARLLLELRLLRSQKWALDLCMGSGDRTLIILDTLHSRHLYPAGQWHHVAVVYSNQTATFYVNGIKDSSGAVTFHPLQNARTSIGARQNPKSWFKGAIQMIQVTPRALVPSEFIGLNAHAKVKRSKTNPQN